MSIPNNLRSILLSVVVPALLPVFLALPGNTQRAKQKSPLELAERYYNEGEYYTAALLYEQWLHPSKKQTGPTGFPLNNKRERIYGGGKQLSASELRYRQSECYRLANYWREAAEGYDACEKEEPGRFPDAKYWYAVCKRSLGHYDTARHTLKLLLASPELPANIKDLAEREWRTLEYINRQFSRPDTVLYRVRKIEAPGSGEKGFYAPTLLNDKRLLVTSTSANPDPVNGTNPYRGRLFYAVTSNGNVDSMEPVTFEGENSFVNQGAATFSADGNHMYFTQWTKLSGKTVSSVFHATKLANGWTKPEALNGVNLAGSNSKQPFCTQDGKYLFFASDRPGGSGNFDIWYAPIHADGSIGEASNAGNTINTEANEEAPFYHSGSETLVFSSDGRTGMGGYDLFAAKGNVSAWQQPQNMGYPVNSSRDDRYFFSPQANDLLTDAIFSSDRGAGCCLESYTVTRTAKNNILRGTIYDREDRSPIPGAVVTIKDVTGNTRTTTTGQDGKFEFDLDKNDKPVLELTVSREKYKDINGKTEIIRIEEKDLFTDIHVNTDLFIERIPEPRRVLKVENVITVFFDFDKSDLKPEGINKLDSLAAVLQEEMNLTIQVSGYTDGMGTDAYNKVLSDKRARRCADYLISKGIDRSRIIFESFGECCPVEMEIINGRDNPDGRSKNRRALINVDRK